MMIKALLIDDDLKNNRILSGLLTRFCPHVAIEGEATGMETAIPLIREKHPDLIFLDIEMPYGNAFDLLDNIMPVDFEVIFITAFDDYTLKAFRYSALDYLLKPVAIDELKAAVQKATERVQHKNINQQLNNLLFNLRKPATEMQKIALPAKEGLVFEPIKNIVRMEAKAGYTSIYLNDQRRFVASISIREYEEMLPSAIFFRIHNSHIINVHYIKKYHKGRGGFIEMEDGSMIEVATRRKDEFLALFGYK